MGSVLEPDYRYSPHFPLQQIPDYRGLPCTQSPQYYPILSGGCNSGVDFASHFPQTPLLNPIQYSRNEYDYFVDGVVSNVLIRVDDGFAYKPGYEEKLAPPAAYTLSQNNLMWESDVAFDPNGYCPSPSPETHIEIEPAPLHGYYLVSNPAPTPTPKPEPEPEIGTIKPDNQEDNPSELAELSCGGLQKLTGRRRRRLLHIIAERNRRLDQNKMYGELYKMVQGVEPSSRSTKRAVLIRTADFLEDLIEGNKKLQQQLRQLPPHPPHGRAY